MPLSVGTILKAVAVLQWLDGDILQNVFNATIAGSGGPYDEEDVVDDMLEWIEDMFANMTTSNSDEIDGSEVRVYEYDSGDDDWDEVGSTAWVYNPSATGDQLPRAVSMLINAKTTNPDVNGKKYLGAPTEGDVDDGLWNATILAQIALFAIDWTTPFTGTTSSADFQPIIWSPTKLTPFSMTGDVIIPTIPAYQRRRKQGVGI